MNFFLFALSTLPAVLAIPASPPNPSQYGSIGPYGNSTSTTPSVAAGNYALRNGPIYPNYNSGKCLDVQGNVQADGTPVDIYDCNGTGAQEWTTIAGSGPTKVQLTGTNFCLDVGLSPTDGTQMKIWTCYPPEQAPQQNFFYTADNRIARPTDSFCLDLTGGILDNGNPVQIWTCGDNNNNQVWTRRG